MFIGRHAWERPAFFGVFAIFLYLGGGWLLNLIAPNLLVIDITIGDTTNVLRLTGNISEMATSEMRFVLLESLVMMCRSNVRFRKIHEAPRGPVRCPR